MLDDIRPRSFAYEPLDKSIHVLSSLIGQMTEKRGWMGILLVRWHDVKHYRLYLNPPGPVNGHTIWKEVHSVRAGEGWLREGMRQEEKEDKRASEVDRSECCHVFHGDRQHRWSKVWAEGGVPSPYTELGRCTKPRTEERLLDGWWQLSSTRGLRMAVHRPITQWLLCLWGTMVNNFHNIHE